MRERHRQRELIFNRRGGRRLGAGRKRLAPRRQVPHRRRPALCGRKPLHVTLRVANDILRLRRRDAFHALRAAMTRSLRRADFRIVHLSIQANHLHLVCEADNRRALTRGIQGFKISAAKKLNAVQDRHGPVFVDRYHEEVLHTPSQVRNALAYVMNNWRKHREDRHATLAVDRYSTGMWFPGWKETRFTVTCPDDLLPCVTPRTWLLAEGWRRTKPISLYEVPGSR